MRMSTWIKGGVVCCVAAGLLAALPTRASAASLTVNSWTLGERVNVRSAGRNGWVNTAELNVTYDGRDGYSYCVDLAQNIGLGTSTGWETLAADASDRVVRAAWLVETFRPSVGTTAALGSGSPSQATLIAALQVAVWEVMGESSTSSYDLFSGGFRLSAGGASTGVMQLARSFLGDLQLQAAHGFSSDATWAYSRTRQDQIVVSPIPEPSSVLLFLGGAGFVAYASQRKRGRVA